MFAGYVYCRVFALLGCVEYMSSTFQYHTYIGFNASFFLKRTPIISFYFYFSMPGKDYNKHPSYPPCNRAFALRMMNPTSYADERTSIFDKEIQPVVKKSIAKSVSESSDSSSRRLSADTISFDGESISPTSSDTSFSEMELYDIDEIDNEAVGTNEYGMIRQHSSLDNYTRSNKVQRNKTVTGNEHMIRSYSSVDGFEGHFSRNSALRSTLPARSSNTPKGTSTNASTRRPYRQDAMAYLNESSKKSTPSKGGCGSSLKRSHSLKNDRTSSSVEKSAEKNKNTKIRVTGTKSSQLRAKLHDSAVVHQPHQHTTATKSRPSPLGKHRQRSRDDYSGSDSSSTAFSELDSSHTRHYQTRHTPNVSNNGTLKKSTNKRRSPKEQNVRDFSTKTSPHASSPLKISSTNMLLSSPNLPKSDTFSTRLTQLCNLISERHPGDFQILETLVEMQSAYEDRNELVKNTISSLREKISSLENKLANSPNIPGLVIPLMRATNTFQNQLQSIMDSSHRTTEMHDISIQFPDEEGINTQPSIKAPLHEPITMAEISNEANNVVKEIEKLGIHSCSSDEHEAVTPTHPKQNAVLNGDGSTEFSLLNGHHPPTTTSDSGNTEYKLNRYQPENTTAVTSYSSDITNKYGSNYGYTGSNNYYGSKSVHYNNNSPLMMNHRVTKDATLTAMAIDSITS